MNYAIIVASGSGKRMGQALPKQFSLLSGKPLLAHVLKAFSSSSFNPKIILVLNAEHVSIWKEHVLSFDIDIPHQIVIGGAERFHSVKNGIEALDGDGLVAIHDGARPLIKAETIDRLFRAAVEFGNAIPVIPAAESVRYQGKPIDRSQITIIQTPQLFELSTLKEAYKQQFDVSFTDDATLVEKVGITLNLVEGQQGNIKVTYPEDLKIAETLQDNCNS